MGEQRYLKQDNGSVYIWQATLAERADMVECDKDGRPVKNDGVDSFTTNLQEVIDRLRLENDILRGERGTLEMEVSSLKAHIAQSALDALPEVVTDREASLEDRITAALEADDDKGKLEGLRNISESIGMRPDARLKDPQKVAERIVEHVAKVTAEMATE